MSVGVAKGSLPPLPHTLIFLIPRIARGGTFSVLKEVWARLPEDRIRLISQEPHSLAHPYSTLAVQRSMGDPLRFPGSWIYSFRIFRIARRAIREASGGAVLIPQDALATGFGAVLAGRAEGAPVIVMDHGSAIVIRTDFFWKERLSRRTRGERLRQPLLRASLFLMYRVTCRLLTRAFLPSQEAMDRFVADGVRTDRVFKYHVPIDLERFHPANAAERGRLRDRFGIPRDRVMAITVSRLTPEKGLDVVLHAVARQPSALRPHVVMGGVGPLAESLQRLAGDLGVDATFLGEVSPDDLPALLRCADLYTYASRQGTNVPVGILEAMASGLIVIGTPQPPALFEMLGNGRGLVVPPDDPAAYSQAMLAADASTPLRREQAGAAARRWVEENHAPEKLNAELWDVLSV